MLIDIEKSIFLEEIGSTNEYMKSDSIPDQSYVIAKRQTKGKGRADKIWDMNGDDPFIFSAKVKFDNVHCPVSLIPLFTASAVLNALKVNFSNLDFKLKWPNDIYLANKKLSGILVESSQIQNQLEVILGIGINFSGKASSNPLYPFSFLSDSNISEPKKKEFLRSLISEINNMESKLHDLRIQKIELRSLFENSLMSNHKVRFSQTGEILVGTPIRFNEYGFLVLDYQGEEITLMDSDEHFGLIL